MGGRGQGVASYPDANEAKLREIGRDWGVELKSSQTEAVSDYTGSFYREINNRLRRDENYGEYGNEKIDSTVKNLDEAIKSFYLPRNITVYRGAKGNSMFGKDLEWMSPEGIIAEFKGAIVRDKGFSSTAIDKDYAWDKSVVYEMRIPKGKGRGAYVDPISSHEGEKEFLVHRDSYWKVNTAYARDDGKVVVVLDYVRQARGKALSSKR